MSARLSSDMWVAAYMARLRLANLPHYLLMRGDKVAGCIKIKVCLPSGQANLYENGYDYTHDAPVWRIATAGHEREVDDWLTREKERDPDLWALEVEDPAGTGLLLGADAGGL